ncbi:MAG: EAL domain-containing protein [Clostridia bacterium]|nr:EAL domain-containing protein [Clostridia bacterium]
MQEKPTRIEDIFGKKHLLTIFDNISNGIVLIERNKTFASLYRNRSFCDMLGCAIDDDTDALTRFFSMVFDDYRDEAYATLQKAAEQTLEPVLTELKIRNLHRDVLHLQATFRRIENENSEQPLILLVLCDVTAQKAQEEKARLVNDQIRYRLEHDELTGLLNRDGFCGHTEKMLNAFPGRPHMLVYFNISRFSVINDLLGTATGNRILQECARRFKKAVQGIGICGRLESDHFVICCPKSYFSVETMLELVRQGFNEIGISDRIIMNFGIYEIDDPNLPVAQMCERANLALAMAKGNHLVPYAYYDEKLRNSIIAEQEIASEMEAALEERQFLVYLQPVHSLSDGEPIGAEALVRWKHPNRGMIPPQIFIQIFEKSGFIARLDHYVWEEACKILKSWRETGKRMLPISVNLSRRSIYNVNLADELKALLAHYGVDPAYFKLEVTETAYTDNPEQLYETVKLLREEGFTIMMDDFGSGYSSLNMLKELPVDVLKIDMKFLEGFETSSRAGSIVAAILRMSRWLNIPVVAEGVETTEQIMFLHSIGCDQIQGYYFAKPMAVQAFDAYVEDYKKLHIVPKHMIKKEFQSNDFLGGNAAVDALMESLDIGVSIVELSGDRLELIRVNQGYYNLFGHSLHTSGVISKNIWEKVNRDDINREKKLFSKAIETRQIQKGVIRCYHSDGRLLWTECTFAFLGGTEDSAVFCVTYVDATRRRKLELQYETALAQVEALTKNMQEEKASVSSNALEKERDHEIFQQTYEILLEDSDALLFDYDVNTDTMHVSFSDESGDRTTKTITDFRPYTEGTAFLHTDYKEQYLELLHQFMEQPLSGEYMLLADLYDRNDFRWYRTKCKSIADGQGVVYRFIGKAEDANDEVRSMEEMRAKTEIEPLSGMLNRATAERMIQEYLRGKHGYCALFVIDIDNFKSINDTLGHLFGDAIIKETGTRLRMIFREEDILGRFGGDEFFAFVQDIRDISVVKRCAKRILNEIASISIPDTPHTHCSVGITLLTPDDKDFSSAFERADVALYEVKNKGKNGYLIYDNESFA